MNLPPDSSHTPLTTIRSRFAIQTVSMDKWTSAWHKLWRHRDPVSYIRVSYYKVPLYPLVNLMADGSSSGNIDKYLPLCRAILSTLFFGRPNPTIKKCVWGYTHPEYIDTSFPEVYKNNIWFWKFLPKCQILGISLYKIFVWEKKHQQENYNSNGYLWNSYMEPSQNGIQLFPILGVELEVMICV